MDAHRMAARVIATLPVEPHRRSPRRTWHTIVLALGRVVGRA